MGRRLTNTYSACGIHQQHTLREYLTLPIEHAVSAPTLAQTPLSCWTESRRTLIPKPNPGYSTAMASHDPLTESQTTFPSDSENYDADHSNPNSSDEPPSSSSSPLIVYQPPTLWSIVRGAAINLLLPFVNGLMLGFGELFAHEAAFRLGWSKTKISWGNSTPGVFPSYRNSRPVGPGIEIRQDPVERRRRDGEEMDAYTALE